MTIALTIWESGLGEIANSPFIVPVAGCAAGLGIVVAAIWSGVRRREMQSQERLAAIASGQPFPPTLEELAMMHGLPAQSARRSDGRGSRRAGIVLVSVALGFVAFFVALTVIVRVREVLSGAAVGLIPLLIGIGFLIDASINARETAATMRDATLDREAPGANELGTLRSPR